MTFDTDAINNIKFTQGFRGYDTAEVDEFLDDMIREIEKLNNTIKNLKEETAKEKRKNQLNQQEIDRLTQMNETLNSSLSETDTKELAPAPAVAPVEVKKEEEKPVEVKKAVTMQDIKGTPEYEEMKQMLTDTLFSAQQHAEELVKDAMKRADQLVEDGERRANERITALSADINESQKKLSTINAMVIEAKQRFKIDFQNQISALDSIVINTEAAEVVPDKVETAVKEAVKEEKHAEMKQETFVIPETPVAEEVKTEVKEEKVSLEVTSAPVETEKAEEKPAEVKEEVKEEVTEEQEKPDVDTFDFAAIKKSLAKEEFAKVEQKPVLEKKPIETATKQNASLFDGSNDVEDENQQYIEIALSAYNDNKHHNTDYPNTQRPIKINEDNDEGGIYQPENRSVLSSVIEEILNNNKNNE